MDLGTDGHAPLTLAPPYGPYRLVEHYSYVFTLSDELKGGSLVMTEPPC